MAAFGEQVAASRAKVAAATARAKVAAEAREEVAAGSLVEATRLSDQGYWLEAKT